MTKPTSARWLPCWLLFARQALRRTTGKDADASTADRDVHRSPPRKDRSRRRILLYDEPSFVGGTCLPSHLAEPETDRGQLTSSGCLPAISGPHPEQVWYSGVVRVGPDEVPEPETSSDQRQDGECEHCTTHKHERRLPRGLRQVKRAMGVSIRVSIPIGSDILGRRF